jgi:hypothetical protein
MFEGLFPNSKPDITFNFPETRVFDSGSCNRYNTDVKIEIIPMIFNLKSVIFIGLLLYDLSVV